MFAYYFFGAPGGRWPRRGRGGAFLSAGGWGFYTAKSSLSAGPHDSRGFGGRLAECVKKYCGATRGSGIGSAHRRCGSGSSSPTRGALNDIYLSFRSGTTGR